MSDPVTEPSDDEAMSLEDAAIAYVQAKRTLARCEGARNDPEFNSAFRAWSQALFELDRAAVRAASDRKLKAATADKAS